MPDLNSGGGLMVSIHILYFKNTCSNHAEVNSFCIKMMFEEKKGKRLGLPK